MKIDTSIALALCVAPAFAVPPADFGFPVSEDDTPLSVQFDIDGVRQQIQPGTLLGGDGPALQPIVAVNESYDSLNYEYTGEYLLFMLDPDASYPQNPTNRWIIHWWQTGLTKSTSDVNDTGIGGTRLVNNTAPQVPYHRPRPPTNSSAHRYIQYLFEQPSNFQIPEQYSAYSLTNSSRFPFEKFLNDTNLGDPVAANYIYCSNQTAVPGNFVAAPGQVYPGGNGAMITQGTNNPTPTSGSTSATSSSSASGTASITAVSTLPAQGAGTIQSGNSVFGIILAIGAAWALL